MPDICIYAQVHQPWRLRRYRLFEVGAGGPYFDDETNARILRRVADKCYLPANRLLLDLVRRTDGRFKVALSLTGTLVDQLRRWAPDALDSFRALAASGGVELLGETYHHSLAALGDAAEFEAQVAMHRRMVEAEFGQRPTVFRNTELIYWDGLAPAIAAQGFRGVMVEGADHVLGWRSANHVYEAASAPGLRLLPRNYRLSDDVGFRFGQRSWEGWPLTAEKYAAWLAASGGTSAHLYVDYETFGEHQWSETGIFDFLRHLPDACAREGMAFVHPSALAAREPVATLAFPEPTSWADAERDTSAWLGNRIQRAAHARLYDLRPAVVASGSAERLDAWRRLTTSDHVYYMCTKHFADGDVHKYFSPYETPYDAFVAFMNVAQDLAQSVAGQPADRPAAEEWTHLAGMACVA